jgi:hypothetical protein
VVRSTDTGVRPTVGVRSRAGDPTRAEGRVVLGAARPPVADVPRGARADEVGLTRGALRFTEVTAAGRDRTSEATADRTGETTEGRGWALRPVRV